MKASFDGRFDYPDMNYMFFDFNKFNDDKKNLFYAYGINALEVSLEYKNRIFFNIEEPNGLYHSGKLIHERELDGKLASNDWTLIYQLCPYSVQWMKEHIHDNRYSFMFNVPICNDIYFPNPNEEKLYDLFYQGSIHGYKQYFSRCIDVIKNFKYVWTSLSDAPDPRKTHIKIPFLEKLKIESQCKITIADNLLYDPYPGAFAASIRKLPKWNLNEAFSHVKYGIMPQFKVKILENMLCKVLVLVEKGPWNTMEKFGFVEGEHFLYFDDPVDLNITIHGCLSEWSYCEKIVENAYNKVIAENSVDAIYNKYLKQYDQD